jgi:hypothetical protein
MNLKKNLIFFFLVLFACACSETEKINYPPKEVTVTESPQEGGSLIHINLSITEIENGKSFSKYHVLSTSKNEKIGFFLRVPNYTFDTEGYGVGIRLLTSGKESDNFLQFLYQTYSKYYIVDTITEFSFTPVTSFVYNRSESAYGDSAQTTFVLHDSPISLTLDTTHRKLIFSMERQPTVAIKQLLKRESSIK